MRRLLATALVLVGLMVALVPAQAEQPRGLQGSTVIVEQPGGQDLPIAVPKPKGGDAVALEIWEVLRADLERSGFFQVIDPDAFTEAGSAGIRLGEFSFEDWAIPDPVVLAKTALELSPGQVSAEVWVYDVPGARKMGAKRFTASDKSTRRVAHEIADEIILLVTGTPGIFTTRFAAVTNASGNKEIALVDVDGHNVTPVTRNGSINLQPAWSWDGSRIAYTSYRSGNPDLFVADLVKGTVKRISSRTGVNIGATWHPGGELLALTLSSGADTDLFAIDETGKALGQLTKAPGIDVSPSFSADGQWIAFASERSGGVQIYVMSAQGGEARRVTFQGSHNTDPSFSPDGQTIAFVGRDGHFDVFTVGVDGKGMKRLTQDQGNNEDPCFSPDGRYIAMASTRSGGGHIWMSTKDGRHQVQVTQGKGGWSNPHWSPRLDW